MSRNSCIIPPMVHFSLYPAISFFIFFLLFKYRNTRKKLLPPGPPGLPIIGNLHQFDNLAPHRYLWRLSQKHGPLMYLQLGCIPTIVVSSAKMAEEVLKIHDHLFCNRPLWVGPKKLTYNGKDLGFLTYNDSRKGLRKICTLQLFSAKRVQSFRSIREDEVSRMIERISEMGSDSEKSINLTEMVMALTSTIISRIAFGKTYNTNGDEGLSRFYGLLEDIQAMLAGFFVEDYFPIMGWVDKINGNSRRLERVFEELDSFCDEIIKEHLDPSKEKSDQEDFVDALLRAKNESPFTMDFTLDHIKAILMDIISAGTDASAAAIIWAMTALIKKPKVMMKAQKEIRELMRNKGFVSEEDLSNIPFLKAIVKETLRLYPPSPLLLPRQTTQTCVIDGYEIPAKTLTFVNAWAIGRDPEAWVDPEEFLPERFIGDSVDFKGLDYKLVPFGAGRRSCPGANMGVITVELALANLLYTFDWGLPYGMKKEEIDTDVKPGLTMHKKTPLCLVPTKYCFIDE